MLLLADDNPGSRYSVHHQKNIIHHQELVEAVKDAIQPGLFQQFYQVITKEMIKDYFFSLLDRQQNLS
jgi:hypothetical protein